MEKRKKKEKKGKPLRQTEYEIKRKITISSHTLRLYSPTAASSRRNENIFLRLDSFSMAIFHSYVRMSVLKINKRKT